ncbi:hypothetical protein [uncultured Dokdonia sp.]|nr:hypothetical protein [uncultured Dokdonia sp.]
MLEQFKNERIDNLKVIYGGKDIVIEDDVVGRAIIIEDEIGG